ncbi:hypothetical protein GF420_12900 [candidate division GN15 bacterium]|nr:hypothetical protein [candidate division GN15 bacterium]
MPSIIVEYDGPGDNPTAINFGEPVQCDRPPLYYSAQTDGTRLYLLLCAYWYADRHHRHDFSGVLATIEHGEPHSLICRAHYRLHFSTDAPWSARALSKSHSFEHGGPRVGYMPYIPDWDISEAGDMHSPGWQRQWKNLGRLFGPWVTLPDRWADMRVNAYLKHFHSTALHEYKVDATDGLIWTAPDVLVRIMEDRFGAMI